MTAEQQHRDIRFCRGKLEAPGSDHGYLARLGHHCCGRTVPDGVLDDGQQRRFVARLRMDDIGCHQPRLLEARRVEVVATAHPQHRRGQHASLAGRDAGEKQSGGGIIDQRGRKRCSLVQSAGPQPSPDQMTIESLCSKRQRPKLCKR